MEPIYCPNCKALLAESVEFCPKCSAATNLDAKRRKESYLGTPPPAAPPREKNQHAGLILFCVIAAGSALTITLKVREVMDEQRAKSAPQKAPAVASAPEPAPAPVAPAYAPPAASVQTPRAALNSEETRRRLEAVGKVVEENGWRMTASGSTVRIYIPRGISEYDAQRVAKMAGERIAYGITVRVYDDAEIQRAQYTVW